MTCPNCQQRANKTSDPQRDWCPRCKQFVYKGYDFPSHQVEYLEIKGKEKLHLRFKGFRTKCGIRFNSTNAVPQYFREVPENACKKCLSL